MSTEKNGSENIREKFLTEQLTKEKKLSLWLWIGVGGFGFIIAFFWIYSLWSNFSSFNWKKTDESKILKQSTTDWDQVFRNNNNNELQNELTKLQLKKVLSEALKSQSEKIPETITTNTIDFSTTTATTTLFSTTTTLTTTTNR